MRRLTDDQVTGVQMAVPGAIGLIVSATWLSGWLGLVVFVLSFFGFVGGCIAFFSKTWQA
jgi:hypothetical protein